MLHPRPFVVLALVLVVAILIKGQSQDIKTIPTTNTTTQQDDRSVRLASIASQNEVANNFSDPGTRVSENVSIKVGPIGELYLVSGLNDFVKVSSGRSGPFIFPSLIFDMSASPVLREVTTKKDKKKVENVDYD